jgi:hypothetical protein
MEWSFFSGAIFGFLLAFCVALLIYLLTDTLDKVNADDSGREEKTPLVIDRRLARYVVKLLEHDNRPAVEELVKQLKRALS